MRNIAEVSSLIRRRELAPVELTRECLERISELNPLLNAFITITGESALREAEQAATEIQEGRWRGPLHGIPIGLKDLIDTAGVRATAASGVFLDRVPAEDADVVKALRAAGAIIVGKQNLHEFAYGGSSLISYFGPVKNPVNPEHIAGGSSGGSAAATASGMCFASIGTDTAGSIREPSSLCGLVGLKPTYGLVSVRGTIPLSVSLDHVGPITRTVEDAAILLDALTGSGKRYQESVKAAPRPFTFGIPRKFFFDDLDPQVAEAVKAAISRFEQGGSTLREVEIEVATNRTVQAAESYAYHRDKLAMRELYQPETLRRILSGEKISQEQYATALEEQKKNRAQAAEIFREVQFLVTPTTPIPAPTVTSLTSDLSLLRPVELILLRNTRPVNVWGLPAISVPCGHTRDGLPIGLQIIGPPNAECEVLQAAYFYEQLRDSG